MASASYCNACGAHNPHGVSSCGICGCKVDNPPRQNPVTSAEFANTKLVVFDIDRTILDTAERHRSAIRAGVQPKDFNYKVFTKMSKKDKKKREDCMYREDMLAKDRLMPNAMALIEHLMKEGYTIAYCTGRSFKWFEKTKNQLESKGFPLFQDSLGKPLLFLRKNESMSKGPYKAGVIKNLLNQYDVRMVFDDTVEVLQEASRLGVPGVYPSINDYWGMISPRSNPKPKAQYDSKAGGQYVPTSSMEYAYQQMVDPDDPDGKTIEKTSYVKSRPVRNNPIKRGRDSKGTYMRWGKSTGKKYYYKAGDKKAREAARKKAHAQAKAAFAGGYRGNPTEDLPELECGCDRDDFDPVDIVTINGKDYCKPCSTNYSGQTRSSSGVAGLLKGMPMWEGYKNPGHLEDYMVPRDVHRVVKSAMVLESRYKEGMEVPEWWKSKLSVTAKDLDSLADALEYVADNPRRNPAPKSKVEKGKQLYKHMNGKDPAKVTKMTIDTGDVWYQVGEGGCWQIGYCSGKETGNSSQKYVHHFNEETKDGNLPNLYATMPENGKPMLIITGGTWKIKTDENGIAWIYD